MEVKYPNWFKVTAEYNFNKFLAHFKNEPNLNFLQLGVYTGDASLWIIENIFCKENCLLTDVDTWLGSDEEIHRRMNFDEVFSIYKNKIQKYSSLVNTKRQDTVSFLRSNINIQPNSFYDFIYIDADHKAASVLVDGELSWRLLKSGGIMAFDDYNWGMNLHEFQRPKLGIDMFLNKHLKELDVLSVNQQVWVKKH